MDHYYDNSIIPEVSDDFDSAQPVPHRKHRFSPHKPLLVAASLLLVLCGIFTVSLRTGIAPSSMAEGDSMPEAPVEEVLPASETSEAELPSAKDLPDEYYNDVSDSTEEAAKIYAPANDIDGDGLLTAKLDIPYDFMGYETMLLSFTLDPETGEYTWKGTCPMATEYLSARGISDTEGFSGLLHDEEFSIIFNAYQNHALETYKSSAMLFFSDGTSIHLGAGDMIDYEKGVFSDTGKLSWLEADYGISLDGLEPAFLIINDQRYELH